MVCTLFDGKQDLLNYVFQLRRLQERQEMGKRKLNVKTNEHQIAYQTVEAHCPNQKLPVTFSHLRRKIRLYLERLWLIIFLHTFDC